MSNDKKEYYAPMHTAEHILNGTIVKLFGCKRSENCHIERKKSKCDFQLSKAPSEDEIKLLEKTVIEVIKQNLDIHEKFYTFDEASNIFDLHRINKSENTKVRIISIGEYDDCPCIGEHVSNTAEIKDFRITTTSFENGIFRVRFKI